MLHSDTQLIAAIVSLLTGLAALYRRTQSGGRIRLRDLPWRAFRRVLYSLRRYLVPVSKPDAPTLTTDKSLDTVENILGDKSYNPDWPLSYYYHGEDYNARLYYKDLQRKYPHRQVHVRGFVQNDGSVELMAHEEPAPEHHPKAHLREHNMQDATDWVRETLNGGKRAQ